MKSILSSLLLFAVTSAHAATLLGVNLAIPVSQLPSCDSSTPPCLHAIAPDVAPSPKRKTDRPGLVG